MTHSMLTTLLLAASLTACAVDVDTGDQSIISPEYGIISPDLESLEFGNVPVGVKKTLAVTLTNAGTTSLTCNLLGSPNAALSFSTTWINELAPGDSLTVDVTYAPGKVGVLASTMDVFDGQQVLFSLPVHGTAN